MPVNNVFDPHEMAERFNFSQMMLHYFKPCPPAQSQLSGMTATELYHLYLVHNPHSKLTSGIVHNLLLMGGYVQKETGTEMELFAKVNEAAFVEAPKEIQLVILKKIIGPEALNYRQIVLGIKVRKVNEDGSYTYVNNPITSVTTFVSRWTINQNDRYHYYMKPVNRSTITEVYNFYRFICAQYSLDIVPRGVFYKALTDMGYNITTGSVHHKAGYRYFRNLYIPQTVDDITLSLDINAVVIFNGHSHWTKDNELLENYTEGLKIQLRERNLRRMNIYDEQAKATPSERQENELDLRREIEILQVPIKQAAPTDAQRAAVEVLMEQARQLEDTTSENQVEEVERTSEESSIAAIQPSVEPVKPVKPISITKPADPISESVEPEPESEPKSKPEPKRAIGSAERHIVKNSAAKRVLAEFDPTYDSTESSIESDDSNTASFEEIAEALKIPFQMTPRGTFTVEVFADWLKKMNIDCPDPRAYYKHVMPLIRV